MQDEQALQLGDEGIPAWTGVEVVDTVCQQVELAAEVQAFFLVHGNISRRNVSSTNGVGSVRTGFVGDPEGRW